GQNQSSILLLGISYPERFKEGSVIVCARSSLAQKAGVFLLLLNDSLTGTSWSLRMFPGSQRKSLPYASSGEAENEISQTMKTEPGKPLPYRGRQSREWGGM